MLSEYHRNAAEILLKYCQNYRRNSYKFDTETVPADRNAKKMRLFSKKGSIGKKLIIINT